MKALFRDNERIFGIENNNLKSSRILDEVVDNIPHLDDAKIIYHCKDDDNDYMIPVYYEYIIENYKTSVIAKLFDGYYIVTHFKEIIRNYTLVNLDLL